MTLSSMTSAVRARWQDLRPREKSLVTTAMTLVLLVLVWWVGISPALKVLRQAGAQQRSLDAQWQQMQGLAAEAGVLQSRPRIKYDDALAALETSVKQGLGPGAQITVSGERATVTLKNVPAGALAQWLTQARANARALPTEARLVRSAAAAGTSAAAWDGSLVLNLPPR